MFWLFTVLVAGAIAFLLNAVYDQGAGAQIAQANRITQDACRELQRKFSWAAQNHSFALEKENQFELALLEIILDHYTSVEGGFWTKDNGFVAYSYPTYEGTGTKRDVPDAEKESIAKVSESAMKTVSLQTQLNRGSREAMVLTACPVDGATQPTVAWTMTRAPIGIGIAYDRFVWGLSLLLGFVLISGILISILLFGWTRNLRKLEGSISGHSIEELPRLPLTNEADLDSIVHAFNKLNDRFRSAKEESKRLSVQLAQSDRLAALGKMAAGIAHEIRNPLATIKLKVENAMVAPQERMERAVPVIIEQIARMDRLIQMLLAMTQPFEIRPIKVEIATWLKESFPVAEQKARERGINLKMFTSVESWPFDPFHIARGLDNLILNALAFTPRGGSITVTVSQVSSSLAVDVEDSGPGIASEIRPRLFEPFATSRPDGTGLGLVLVKEIAEAHGGTIREVAGSSGQGAHFRLELPWPKS